MSAAAEVKRLPMELRSPADGSQSNRAHKSSSAQSSSRKSKGGAGSSRGGKSSNAAASSGAAAAVAKPSLGTVTEEGAAGGGNAAAAATNAAATAAAAAAAHAPVPAADLAAENARLNERVQQLTLDLAVAHIELKGAASRVEEAEEDQAAAEAALETERSRTQAASREPPPPATRSTNSAPATDDATSTAALRATIVQLKDELRRIKEAAVEKDTAMRASQDEIAALKAELATAHDQIESLTRKLQAMASSSQEPAPLSSEAREMVNLF